ncbi:hypothetical protein [Vibrio splendidus]|uniref:hypothetical protein n=1 Tax=Vibrio splendidus TaxID=29497 RepID=UPI00021C35E4|nr:hypothetical protein [Vibrio splendidus]EGU39772.1 hypothetical protein VISP3789_08608 [Vibrio splendidus ATCC 33789]
MLSMEIKLLINSTRKAFLLNIVGAALLLGSASASASCLIMKKHANFYEEIGKVENGYVKKKYSNFYEEVGRVKNGYIETKHANFYEEIGRVRNSYIEKNKPIFMKKLVRLKTAISRKNTPISTRRLAKAKVMVHALRKMSALARYCLVYCLLMFNNGSNILQH